MARKLRVEYEGAIYHVMSRGGPARSDIQGRPGSGAVFGDSGASLPEDGLAGARVVFDGQSLSPGRGNAQGQSGGGDEMVFGDLHGAIQPAAQGIGADGGEGGSLALWGRATGIGRGKGATDRGRGDEEAGVGPSGSGAASERGPAEGANSAAAAAGDDHDIEMDSGEVEDGDMDPRNQPALPPEKVNLCQYSGPTRFWLHHRGTARSIGRALCSCPRYSILIPSRLVNCLCTSKETPCDAVTINTSCRLQ
jgi:hypothetical protein